jgi:hypothetical protein
MAQAAGVVEAGAGRAAIEEARRSPSGFLAVVDGGVVVGLLGPDDPPPGPGRPVAEAMVPLEPADLVDAGADLADLRERTVGRRNLVVVEGGRMVGVLTPDAVRRALADPS